MIWSTVEECYSYTKQTHITRFFNTDLLFSGLMLVFCCNLFTTHHHMTIVIGHFINYNISHKSLPWMSRGRGGKTERFPSTFYNRWDKKRVNVLNNVYVTKSVHGVLKFIKKNCHLFFKFFWFICLSPPLLPPKKSTPMVTWIIRSGYFFREQPDNNYNYAHSRGRQLGIFLERQIVK